jgi:hypothetical protein
MRLRRKRVPDATGKRHDYRRQTWGHTCQIRRTQDVFAKLPVFRGHAFARNIHVGDEIILEMESGRSGLYRVIEANWCTDPGDMYLIKCVPVGYLEEPHVQAR